MPIASHAKQTGLRAVRHLDCRPLACCSLERNSNCSTATAPAASKMGDRKSTRLNSSHGYISYAVFCLKKKNKTQYVHALRFLTKLRLSMKQHQQEAQC